jgi:hypothetical protein
MGSLCIKFPLRAEHCLPKPLAKPLVIRYLLFANRQSPFPLFPLDRSLTIPKISAPRQCCFSVGQSIILPAAPKTKGQRRDGLWS